MAYINTAHSVGDTVYHHDADTDSVWRGTVAAIKATCRDGSKYSSTFNVTYDVDFADGSCEHSEDDLHTSALSAFNSAPAKVLPEPIPVPEVTMVPMPETAAAGDTF